MSWKVPSRVNRTRKLGKMAEIWLSNKNWPIIVYTDDVN